MRLKITAGIKI